jgi:hypothetical protein
MLLAHGFSPLPNSGHRTEAGDRLQPVAWVPSNPDVRLKAKVRREVETG